MAQAPVLSMDLSGDWRVQLSDDPDFAKPDFDDSGWSVMRLPRSGSQPKGYWWLRRTVEIPSWADASQLALTLGGMNEVYEVFVNGVRAGSVGEARLAKTYVARPRTFLLPPQGSRRITIALRLWYSGWISSPVRRQNGFPDVGPYLLTYHSNATRDAAAASMARRERYAIPGLMLSVCDGLLAILLLFCWLFRRDRRDIPWLTGLFLIECGAPLYKYLSIANDWPHLSDAATGICLFSGPFLLAYFTARTLGRRLLWLRVVAWLLFLTLLWGEAVVFWADFHGGWLRQEGFGRFFTQYVLMLIYAVFIASAQSLWRMIRMRDWAGAVTPAAITLFTLLRGQFGPYSFLPFVNSQFLVLGLFVSDLLSAVWALGLTVHMIRNLGAARQRLMGEMEAARSVQQLLLSAGQVRTEHWSVEAEYHPAQEVGGDFYQAFALENGELLVAIGDVSGKGLKAAMLVAMMTGVLRSHREKAPALLLGEMNRALAGNSGGGFVTCLIARFEQDGTLTLANAGHLAPYHREAEVELPAGLPLGLAADADYSESQLRLGAKESIVFVTDGIVEAANAKDELFGFERTRAMSGRPIADIADAAKAWGQNDDITVVTVRRNNG